MGQRLSRPSTVAPEPGTADVKAVSLSAPPPAQTAPTPPKSIPPSNPLVGPAALIAAQAADDAMLSALLQQQERITQMLVQQAAEAAVRRRERLRVAVTDHIIQRNAIEGRQLPSVFGLDLGGFTNAPPAAVSLWASPPDGVDASAAASLLILRSSGAESVSEILSPHPLTPGIGCLIGAAGLGKSWLFSTIAGRHAAAALSPEDLVRADLTPSPDAQDLELINGTALKNDYARIVVLRLQALGRLCAGADGPFSLPGASIGEATAVCIMRLLEADALLSITPNPPTPRELSDELFGSPDAAAPGTLWLLDGFDEVPRIKQLVAALSVALTTAYDEARSRGLPAPCGATAETDFRSQPASSLATGDRLMALLRVLLTQPAVVVSSRPQCEQDLVRLTGLTVKRVMRLEPLPEIAVRNCVTRILESDPPGLRRIERHMAACPELLDAMRTPVLMLLAVAAFRRRANDDVDEADIIEAVQEVADSKDAVEEATEGGLRKASTVISDACVVGSEIDDAAKPHGVDILPSGTADKQLAGIDRRSPVAGLYIRAERLLSPQVWATRVGAAALEALVSAILSHPRLDPLAIDDDGRNLLHVAAWDGHVPIMQSLLSNARIDPTAVDNEGRTPLHYAASRDHAAVVATLLADPRVNPSVVAEVDRAEFLAHAVPPPTAGGWPCSSLRLLTSAPLSGSSPCPSPSPLKVFVSYFQATGGGAALCLCEGLHAVAAAAGASLDLWFDLNADPCADKLNDVKDADVFLLIMSPGVLTFPAVQHEVASALAVHKRFVVVAVDGASTPDILAEGRAFTEERPAAVPGEVLSRLMQPDFDQLEHTLRVSAPFHADPVRFAAVTLPSVAAALGVPTPPLLPRVPVAPLRMRYPPPDGGAGADVLIVAAPEGRTQALFLALGLRSVVAARSLAIAVLLPSNSPGVDVQNCDTSTQQAPDVDGAVNAAQGVIFILTAEWWADAHMNKAVTAALLRKAAHPAFGLEAVWEINSTFGGVFPFSSLQTATPLELQDLYAKVSARQFLRELTNREMLLRELAQTCGALLVAGSTGKDYQVAALPPRYDPGIVASLHAALLEALATKEPESTESKKGTRPRSDSAAVSPVMSLLTSWASATASSAARKCDSSSAFLLHRAIAHSVPSEVIKALILARPNIAQERNQWGELPLHTAFLYHAPRDVITVLLQAYPEAARFKNSVDSFPLHDACVDGFPGDVLTALVSAYPAALKTLEKNFDSFPDDVISALSGAFAGVVSEFKKNGGGDALLNGLCGRSASTSVVSSVLIALSASPSQTCYSLPTFLLMHGETYVAAFEALLDAHAANVPDIALRPDATGRTALGVAGPLCKAALKRRLYLFGRYEVTEQVHTSATSRVFFALDHDADGSTVVPRIVLKFMWLRDQFNAEVDVRKAAAAAAAFFLPVLAFYDGTADATLSAFLKARGLSTHPFLLVLPAGDRSLEAAAVGEAANPDWPTEAARACLEIAEALQALHATGCIHGDVKPRNVIRLGAHYRLIDFDAAVPLGEVRPAKLSTAYAPPEAFVRSPAPLATTAVDAWGLGATLYRMLSSTTLVHATDADDVASMAERSVISTWADATKVAKLSSIADMRARNLLGQLLHRDPLKRPTMARALQHPFFTRRESARLPGEAPLFDVFLSYRVASDASTAEELFNALTAAGLRVWWDKRCLVDGQPWRDGFFDGLIKSRAFVPIISRGSHKAVTASGEPSWGNWEALQPDSGVDNVLLEHRAALECLDRGLLDFILPVFVGDAVTDEASPPGTRGPYFRGGCAPSSADVVVAALEVELRSQLDRAGLGTPYVEAFTAREVFGRITGFQGKFIEGDAALAFATACDAIQNMVLPSLPAGSIPGDALPTREQSSEGEVWEARMCFVSSAGETRWTLPTGATLASASESQRNLPMALAASPCHG